MENFKMAPKSILRYFDPTAATASMFLYAQGNSVVCCHHDTLTIERRFTRHSDEVQLLAVDTQSELGAGRLVVSYDAGQTAIVWDIMSGEEVARFASYEHLTAAAWMRNGNVAFGESTFCEQGPWTFGVSNANSLFFVFQATRKETSCYLSRPLQNTSPPGQLIKLQ